MGLRTLLKSFLHFFHFVGEVSDCGLLDLKVLVGFLDLLLQSVDDQSGALAVLFGGLPGSDLLALVLAVTQFQLLKLAALCDVQSLTLSEVSDLVSELLLVELALGGVVEELDGYVVNEL